MLFAHSRQLAGMIEAREKDFARWYNECRNFAKFTGEIRSWTQIPDYIPGIELGDELEKTSISIPSAMKNDRQSFVLQVLNIVRMRAIETYGYGVRFTRSAENALGLIHETGNDTVSILWVKFSLKGNLLLVSLLYSIYTVQNRPGKKCEVFTYEDACNYVKNLRYAWKKNNETFDILICSYFCSTYIIALIGLILPFNAYEISENFLRFLGAPVIMFCIVIACFTAKNPLFPTITFIYAILTAIIYYLLLGRRLTHYTNRIIMKYIRITPSFIFYNAYENSKDNLQTELQNNRNHQIYIDRIWTAVMTVQKWVESE